MLKKKGGFGGGKMAFGIAQLMLVILGVDFFFTPYYITTNYP